MDMREYANANTHGIEATAKEEVIAESNVTCFPALLSAFASRNWPIEWQQFCEVVDAYEKQRMALVSVKIQENENKTVYDGLEVRKI